MRLPLAFQFNKNKSSAKEESEGGPKKKPRFQEKEDPQKVVNKFQEEIFKMKEGELEGNLLKQMKQEKAIMGHKDQDVSELAHWGLLLH